MSEGGGTVVLEEEDDGRSDTMSRTSEETRKTRTGFDFLEDMKEGMVDKDLERTRRSERKRKRQEDMTEVRMGMDRIAGWEWRGREGREEKRWKREVTEVTSGGTDGEWVEETKTEKIPLLDTYRLGLDGRGKR